MIRSRRMRQAGYVARMREMKNVYTILISRPQGEKSLVIFWRKWDHKLPLRKQSGEMWIGFIILVIESGDELL
jgi:hypothetical protein